MKTIAIIIIGMFLTSLSEAGIIVTDPTLIAVQRVSSERDYLEQLLHGISNESQVLRLAQQIKQFDDYLKRYGNPADIKKLNGSEVLDMLLKQKALSKTAHEILTAIKGAEAFKYDPIYQRVTKQVTIDGKVVGKRAEERYLPEVAAKRSIENYRKIHTSTLSRRKQLKAAIASANHQLKLAKTGSEVQKISSVKSSLEAELTAIDSESNLAKNEVFVRWMENQVQESIEKKALVENERAKLRHGTLKDARTFKIDTEPLILNWRKK